MPYYSSTGPVVLMKSIDLFFFNFSMRIKALSS